MWYRSGSLQSLVLVPGSTAPYSPDYCTRRLVGRLISVEIKGQVLAVPQQWPVPHGQDPTRPARAHGVTISSFA